MWQPIFLRCPRADVGAGDHAAGRMRLANTTLVGHGGDDDSILSALMLWQQPRPSPKWSARRARGGLKWVIVKLPVRFRHPGLEQRAATARCATRPSQGARSFVARVFAPFPPSAVSHPAVCSGGDSRTWPQFRCCEEVNERGSRPAGHQCLRGTGLKHAQDMNL